MAVRKNYEQQKEEIVEIKFPPGEVVLSECDKYSKINKSRLDTDSTEGKLLREGETQKLRKSSTKGICRGSK